MILTVNVSNSNILLGAYQDDKQCFCSSMHTNLLKSADEYAVQFGSVLSLYGAQPGDISGVILSCVVPSMLACVRKALNHLYTGRIYVAGPGLKTGLSIRTDDPSQLGSELVCSAIAVLADYPPPCVIISMDTAVSITALDNRGALRGGAILPGVKIGVEALCARTAQLPQIDLSAPACGVLGTNSSASMQAGAIFGTASMLDGMIDRLEEELSQDATVVATGGIAPFITPHCKHKIVCDDTLLLKGLYLIYNKNC